MRLLLFSVIVSLISTSSSWAWPPRTYVVVGPAPGVTYVQRARLINPQIITYSQPAVVTYSQPAVITYPQPAVVTHAQPAVQMPLAQNEDAAALARLQVEVRQLTQEANVRALQSRVLELERRQVAPK